MSLDDHLNIAYSLYVMRKSGMLLYFENMFYFIDILISYQITCSRAIRSFKLVTRPLDVICHGCRTIIF